MSGKINNNKNDLNRAIELLTKAIERSEIRKKKIQAMTEIMTEKKNENI
jgi:ferritin